MDGDFSQPCCVLALPAVDVALRLRPVQAKSMVNDFCALPLPPQLEEQQHATIPIDVIAMILRRANPKDAIRFAAVSKEWKSEVERCGISVKNTPWLAVLAHQTPDDDDHCLMLLKASDDSGDTAMVIKLGGVLGTDLCICAYHGWLVLKNRDFRGAAQVRLSLLNPLSGARIDLPVVEGTEVSQLYLSSAPVNSECVAMAKGNGERELVYWRHGDKKWNQIKLVPLLPEFEIPRTLLNLLLFQGHLYVLDDTNGSWGTTDVEIPHCLLFRQLPTPEADMALQWACHSDHLVESVGGRPELWHVKIFKDDGAIVRNSIVFSWDTKEKTWSKVDRLDGVALLLDGNRLIAVSAPETGCRENCIYVSGGELPAVAWRVYDRKDHSVTSVPGTGTMPCNATSDMFWITPT